MTPINIKAFFREKESWQTRRKRRNRNRWWCMLRNKKRQLSDNDRIVRLTGPERVRRRPAVIFCTNDHKGAMKAVEMLLDIFVQEASVGHSSLLKLTLHKDGAITIEDNGQGIYFGEDDQIWEALFCQLNPASPYYETPRYNIFEPPAEEERDNLEIHSVTCVSRYMDVQANRDDYRYQLHFEKGLNQGGLRKEPDSSFPYTRFHFLLDPEVFTRITLSAFALKKKMRSIAAQIPGLKTVFAKENAFGTKEKEFCFPKESV